MLSSEQYNRLHDVFSHASGLEAADREAFLAEACLGDEQLRREVERMLELDADDPGKLDEPALGRGFDMGDEAALNPDARLVGRQIGKYRLTRLIATGGMGTVYEATQAEPARTVAVKVMRQGLQSTSVKRRFRYEADVLGRLHHPGIAQIYEAGTASELEDLPYFVMEFIPDAMTVTRYAREKKLSVFDRLALFARICDAVHHGHQKGVIHRDLKPGNILVESETGDPRIIDFGVARATDSDIAITTIQTDVGQLIGTLQYMSPEQCAADPNDIDIRSDVYSLGVVLYELLSDSLPYDLSRAAVHEAMRVIRDQPPTRLSDVDRTLRGDLETIAQKALQKERKRRYQSAAELGADVTRFLRDEPIEARPPSALYQMRKFAKRHRAMAGAVSTVFVILVVAVVVTSLALSGESEQRQVAEARTTDAQRQQRVAEAINEFLREGLLRSVSPDNLGHDVTMREALDAASANLDGRFTDEPEVAAAIHLTIGVTYRDLGAYDQVENHLLAAARLFDESVGADSAEAIETRTTLAGFYDETSRFDEADAILQPLLDTSRRALGDDHLRTASILTELGHVARARGHYEEAEARHREALPIYREVTGERSDDVARCLSNIGVTLRQQMRYDEAEPLYEESITIMTEIHGESHPQTLEMVNNLGVVYYSTQRYDMAVTLFRDLLQRQKAVLPPDHPNILITELNLGTNLDMAGEFDEALEIAEALRPRMVQVLGAADYYTIIVSNNLANSYRRVDRLDEAEALFVEVIEQIEAINPDHQYIAAAYAGLAHVELRREAYEEADKHYSEVFRRLRALYAEHHPEIMQYRRDYADSCLKPWGKYKEAETELLGAYEVSLGHYGADSRGTQAIRLSLADLYDAWGKPDQAEQWRARVGPVQSGDGEE